jgi:hypothetical protein
MTSALKTVETVASSARTHANPKTRVISKETTLPYGYTIRQGDVMLTRHPLGTALEQGDLTDNYQLAPGSTVGSRHVLRRDRRLVLRTRQGASPLQGPILEATEGFYLEHPTHAHVDCRLPGLYEITYPRDLAAEGLQRRKD